MVCAKLIFATAVLFFSGCKLSGQNWRFHIPVQLDVGMQFTAIDDSEDFSVTQNPGAGIQVQSGVNLLYRKSFAISWHGGVFLNTFDFYQGNSNYSVGHVGLRSGFGAHWLSKPINSSGSRIHIGGSTGYTFLDGERETSVENGLRVEASTLGRSTLFFSPEIGLSQVFDKGSMDLLFCYFRHVSPDPTIEFNFSRSDQTAQATGKEGYFGLRFRYYFRLRRAINKVPVQPIEPNLLKQLEVRNEREHSEIFTTRQEIVKLRLYDKAQEDQDSISVFLNDSLVLSYHEVKNSKRTLHLPLKKGENKVLVIAHNLGTTPPNTASAVLIMGLKRKEIPVRTSLRANQSILIKRE